MTRLPSRISLAVRRNVCLVNLGCKVNRYDGECLLHHFHEVGFNLDNRKPDLIIVNTCIVTKTAEVKSRKIIRRMRRRFPNAEILITGCLKYDSRENCLTVLPIPQRRVMIEGLFPLTERSRYYLKVEDGCDKGCSFCILPKVRGAPSSKPLNRIIAEIEYAKGSGFSEIVIVGINIGRFDPGLPGLIRELSKICDLPRIRVSSIEPEYINRDLVRALHNIPFCRHLHISLQHTEDDVLTSMNRVQIDIEEVLGHLCSEFPGINIGADIIVGFPTETAKLFCAMVKKIRRLPISYLHVFPFSPRPGTEANSLRDLVPYVEKKERVNILRKLSVQKRLSYARSFIGEELDAVVEKKDGRFYGLTDNYLRMRIMTGCPKNKIKVRPIEIKDGEIIGELV